MMCTMTDLGIRWKRAIPLPDFGDTVTYWAVSYNGETRYMLAPSAWHEKEARFFNTPLYAIRVTARRI